MPRFTSRLLAALALAFVLWAGVAAVAMVSQLADAADRLWLGSGQWVFMGLLGAMLASVLVPTVWLLRLPPALRYPEGGDSAALQRYQQQLRAQLAANPRLAGHRLHTDADVQAALGQLRQAAERTTQSTAATVLASTALLQNGRLDGLIVLSHQVRLVWRIARIYGLRPSLRQLSYLYANVAACMLVADSLDDLDFAALSAPLVQAAAPAALGSVPGLGSMGSLLTNSLASGSANAFLSLRVGLITSDYCAPLHQPERAQVRRSATVRAAQLLGHIVKDCGSQVTQAIYKRLKDGVVHTAHHAADTVKDAGRSLQTTGEQLGQQLMQKAEGAAATVRDSASATGQQSARTLQDTVSRLQTALQSWTPKNKP